MLAPSGSVASSASLYPTLLATCSAAPEPQHDGPQHVPPRLGDLAVAVAHGLRESAPSCPDSDHALTIFNTLSFLRMTPAVSRRTSDLIPHAPIMVEGLFLVCAAFASLGGSSKPTWTTLVLPGNNGHDSWAWSQTVTT